jgi:hypothetical protein
VKAPGKVDIFEYCQRNFQRIDHIKKSMPLVAILAMMMALSAGCASQRSAEKRSTPSNIITDIVVSEDSESLIVTIKGNQSLKNETIRHPDPIGVEFRFPGTTLEIAEGFYNPPKNDIIRFIKADEVAETNTLTSRIFIALKEDRSYTITPDASGLQVAFAKTLSPSEPIESRQEMTPKPSESTPTETQNEFTETTLAETPIETEKEVTTDKPQTKQPLISAPAATQLMSVTATPLKNNLVVHIKADGAINDYTSFTMDNPARIVFDMHSISSPGKAERRIAVGSKWVNRIRYFGHPNKVRLVLETHSVYLSKYSAAPIDTGLLIHVGQIPAPTDQSSTMKLDENLGTEQITLAWDGVSKATYYNIYWSSSPGVTKYNGTKIANAKNPQTVKGLKRGETYYFVVTAVSESGESEVSDEIVYTVGEQTR